MTNEKIFDEIGCPDKLKECQSEIKRQKMFIKKEDSKASQRALDEWSESGMIISDGPTDEEYLFNNLINKELKKIKNNN